MHRVHAFHRRTRRGKVQKMVREHYLRDDIASGVPGTEPRAPDGVALLSDEPYGGRYLVLDTNVVLHQMDLLEQDIDALRDVVVPQTVMAEVRHRDVSLYKRLQALVRDGERRFFVFANEHNRATYVDRARDESPNDYNDRAIRVTAKWYQDQLLGRLSVLLVSDDGENRRRAAGEGIEATSAMELARALQGEHPGLVDLIARPAPTVPAAKGARSSGPTAGSAKGSAPLFRKYLPEAEVARRLRERTAFQGCIRASRFSWAEGSVSVRGLRVDGRPFGDDKDAAVAVRVSGREDVNRALDGDIVAIELLPRAEWGKGFRGRDSSSGAAGEKGKKGKKGEKGEKGKGAEEAEEADVEDSGPRGATLVETHLGESAESQAREQPRGRVIGVIRRNWRQLCGSIRTEVPTPAGIAMFVPVNRRVPKVRIHTRQKEALAGKRIVVAVDSWNVHSAYPDGHFVRTIGDVGDRETETEVILLEHDIPAGPFPRSVLACLPPKDWAITPENSAGRVDLRDRCVCSIDPPGCKDIDDALHARALGGGRYEVGVHIADVAYFVPADTAIDEEARNRSTSTYLVERRLDMLPGLLTETLCSVRGGEDKFVFSVVWEVDEDMQVLDVRFHRSIVHSRAALSYGEAQAMLDDPAVDTEVARGVRILNKLARVLRRKRMEAGALTLASPEVRFQLDELHNPVDVATYQVKETNALVEEFMLFANCTVAKRILEAFPQLAVLRRHPAPSERAFDSLIGAAKLAGFPMRTESSKALAESLDAAHAPGEPYVNQLIRILTTRCMTQAEYFCSGEVAPEQYRHYGLAAPLYTHFTSPIRRYADVMVHRLLAAAIGLAPLPHSYEDRAFMHDTCSNMNRRHLMAQQAGRASVDLYTRIFFRERPVEVDAFVMAVRGKGVEVIVPQFGIEGPVQLNEERDPEGADEQNPYEVCQGGYAMRHYRSGHTLRVFDKVRARVALEKEGEFHEEVVIRLLESRKRPPTGKQQEAEAGEQEAEEGAERPPRKKSRSGKRASGSRAKKARRK